ncbi:very short patch repair endonuclease [Bradyrhizobium sp. WSM4349]|uniref:very short patch repair endonuclease n=1 Tax=Bradyrhizobium sp. WSM4349 TaxID=1040988 RepID=UPI000368288F|nr:very short patch repair endonuclease [Bradyrhizobium sp. WSM4349]
MDRLTPEARSRNMARIRSRDTTPEVVVRKLMHAQGLRFRLHRRDLPGKPDLVFAGRRVVLFVHGCFWHGCPKCIDGTRKVKSNQTYWHPKIAGNRERDARHAAALQANGWKVFTIWECDARERKLLDRIAKKIKSLPQTIASSRKK